MASPQTKDGFVMIALDLFPAIMSAGLSTHAQVVLGEFILQAYGPAKLDKVTLGGTDLQVRIGVDRANIRRGIRELVEANILVASGEEYAINKDYESWTPKTGTFGARLDGKLLKWIEHSPERIMDLARSRKRGFKPDACTVSTQTHETADHVSTQTHQTEIRVSTQTHPDDAPLEPPYRKRGRELENREERIENTPPAPQRGRGGISEDIEPFACDPGESSALGACLPISTQINPVTARVAVLAEQLFPTREWGRKSEEAVKHYGPAIVERSLRETHAMESKDGEQRGWGYVLKVAKSTEKRILNPSDKAERHRNGLIADIKITRAPEDSIWHKTARVG